MFTFLDKHLNPYLLPNQVPRFPQPLRRFLGGNSPTRTPDYLLCLEIVVGTFCGIAVIEAVFKSHTVFSQHHAPLIIASYGASAILCFNAIASPLAQPRNVLLGHFISSVIGMGIHKLFLLSSNGENSQWAAGALSVALLSAAMSLLNCVHPPGGASALIPCVDAQVQSMGWWYLPVQLVSSVLMISVACIFGNFTRKYPIFWWTPDQTGKHPPELVPEKNLQPIVNSLSQPATVKTPKITRHPAHLSPNHRSILITVNEIGIPLDAEIGELEEEWLKILHKRLFD